MSTTFPYLSKRGNRSSAVVPARNEIERKIKGLAQELKRKKKKKKKEKEKLRKVMLRTRRE